MAEPQWTLQDIEESLQERISYLSKTDLGDVPYSEYTDCYMALAQIRQAQALERIEKLLRAGIPIERV